MKQVIFTIVAVLCIIQAATAVDLAFGKYATANGVCRRNLSAGLNPLTKTIHFTSKALCIDRKNATLVGAFSDIDFFASIARFPIVGMVATSVLNIPKPGQSANPAQQTIAVSAGSVFGFDALVEYREANGVDGYQPGADTIVNMYRFSNYTWNVDSITRTAVDATNSSYVYQASVSATIPNFCTVKFGVMAASDAVSFSSSKFVNRTGIVQVLVPSSVKVSLEVLNIKYTDATTKIALGTILGYRGRKAVAQYSAFSKDVNGNQPEQPDTASADQSVTSFDDNVSTQLGGNSASLPKTFFSFQNFISKYPTSSPTNVTRGRFISTNSTTVIAGTVDELAFKAILTTDAVIERFWMSTVDQPDNFVFDPSVGSSDQSNAFVATSTATNASPVVFNQFNILVLMFIAALASFLMC